jgi:RNA polymerase sigma factor (sigma-70 family)
MSDAPAGALPSEPSTRDGRADPLALAASRREKRAFERIFKKFHQEIYRYCLSILRRPEDAEDALQATMAAALRALPGEKRDIALKPWLYRVAHNESISLLRQRRPTAELDETNDPIIESAHEQAASRDRLRTLVADLGSLPERQSSALVMRELNGLSYDEIGAALECSGAAARQSVYEARMALRTLEEGRDMDCADIRLAISDQDRRKLRGRKIRSHLSACDGCRGFAASIDQRTADLRALCPPLPAMAATAIASGLVGGASGLTAGGGAAGAGTVGGALGLGGLGGTGVAGSAAVKGASILAGAVIAAGAVDATGVVDLPNPSGLGGGWSKSDETAAPAARGSSGAGSSANNGASASHNDRSAVAPGNTGSSADAPGHGGSTPGDSANAPGHGGNSPGASEQTPGHEGSSPGNSGSAPGHSGSSPGNSGSAPGHTGSSPGNSGSAPGQTGSSPGNSEYAPGHSGTSPGNSGSAPGQTGAAGNSGSAPGHIGSTGNSVSTPSVPQVSIPGNSGSGSGLTSPGNSGNAPGHNK